MWASLGGIPRLAQKKKKKKKKKGWGEKKEGKTLVHDPELTPPLIQAHGLGLRVRINARGA